MNKNIMVLLMIISFGMCLSGCMVAADGNVTETEADSGREQMFFEEEQGHFKDNDALYVNTDNTSVITMYLTVSKGNASENTNHTWKEVNSYSVYDYAEMGVERYAVNGLLQIGDENGPAEGELGYGKYVPNATVTIRGQTSSRLAQKNYKIKLYEDAGSWKDQKVINLNKHAWDGLRFRNKLAYDLMEELPDMMALQTQFVHLYVKDETEGEDAGFRDYGLYTHVEQPNKSFLKRHGLDKNGHLYKINFFEFFRYEDVIRLKNDADYDEAAFEEMIEIKGNDDHSKLIAMLEDVNDLSIPMEDILEEWFDIENLASWMAFHILIGNDDTQSRNTLIYSAQNDKKWYFISWDNDACLKKTEKLLQYGPVDSGWEYGISNYWGNQLFQRALKTEVFQNALSEKIEEYYAFMSEEKINSMAEAYAEVVKPYAYGAADKYYEPITEREYDIVCKELWTEIETNYRRYKESREYPMPFYIGIPQAEGGVTEFIWENAYDFDNENVLYSFELADNLEFKNPIAAEQNISFPGYTYKGTLEPGQYFARIKAVNESGKEQYAFDYYVTDDSKKAFGIMSFYVMQDGSIEVYVHEE